ncbi:uncharacterized protein A4U43_C01F5990 [Asparagus officinalis]|uniref:Aldehyde dehydrogenase domain-containing protein n=1 Tax=Asparagus officinalis TaxID=4686 RepID=A0A5P1FMQ7_ASPOF|nr:uncharacterized protein A4U43_C01F5990 [Asparagus officinalis]
MPWNLPMLLFAWKIGLALACGNALALKTAEQTPAFALYAGLPAEGVLNIVSGFGPTAGTAIAGHMEVDKAKSYSDSLQKATLKPVTLELGGKSPMIIVDDADVDQAVELRHSALFFNQIDDKQFKKILGYIKSGLDSGASLITGGERIGSKGYVIEPTIFSDVKDDMAIAKDEIFGPVQTILKFNDLDEAIKRANNSRYGLAAGVFTSNIGKANTLARALEVGTVWVKCFDSFRGIQDERAWKREGY